MNGIKIDNPNDEENNQYHEEFYASAEESDNTSNSDVYVDAAEKLLDAQLEYR